MTVIWISCALELLVVLHDGVVAAIMELDEAPPPIRPLPSAGVHVGLSVREFVGRRAEAPSKTSSSGS